MNHLAQPASFGLYDRAIVESGTYNLGANDRATAEASYQSVSTSASRIARRLRRTTRFTTS